MPRPTLGGAVRALAEATAKGVKRGRIFSINEGNAIVQAGRDVSLASTSTDEPLRAGDAIWCQPVKRKLVIHGR